MDLYGELIGRVLFPAWEGAIRRRPTFSLLRYVEQTQWRSLAELQALQIGALRRLLRHAEAHVPYYAALLRDAGVEPSALRSVDDLQKIPILGREQAQGSEQSRRSTSPPYADIIKRTSGTSGKPLTFGYDWGSEHWRQAIKLRGYAWARWRVGVKTLHYWGIHPSPRPPTFAQRTKIRIDRALKREQYVSCGARSDDDMNGVVEILRRERPTVMIGYSQALADLARHVVDHGLRSWPDIAVICAAEKVFPGDRAHMERAFGPSVFETYGSREVMLIASECEAHDGMHVSMENLIVEVVVREDGRTRAARPGEVGEVLITDLHNYGMPFIRYANGDLAVAGKPERCACGRNLLKISGLEGRVSDTLRDAKGGRVAGMMFAVFMAHVGHAVRQFQAVQHPSGALTFRYVPGPQFNDDVQAYLQTSIEGSLKGFPVQMERVDDIPVSPSGKRRVVIVEPVGTPLSRAPPAVATAQRAARPTRGPSGGDARTRSVYLSGSR